jgi:hypothetical protein
LFRAIKSLSQICNEFRGTGHKKPAGKNVGGFLFDHGRLDTAAVAIK